MSPSPFEFNLRPNIHYRVQIWTLTWSFHEPDGLVLKPLLGHLCSIGKKIIVRRKPFCNILLYPKTLIEFSQRSASLWYIHHDISHQIFDASPHNSCFIVILHSARLWIKRPIFGQKPNSVFHVFLRWQWVFKLCICLNCDYFLTNNLWLRQLKA